MSQDDFSGKVWYATGLTVVSIFVATAAGLLGIYKGVRENFLQKKIVEKEKKQILYDNRRDHLNELIEVANIKSSAIATKNDGDMLLFRKK